MITPHRALSLAIAALGDCARTIDNVGYNKALAAEVREAADFLIALRDKESPSSVLPAPSSFPHEPSTTQNRP